MILANCSNRTFDKLDKEKSNEIKLLEAKPPNFLGAIISNASGKMVFYFEIYQGALEYFIKKNIKDPAKRNSFDIELISMFLSAMNKYSEEIELDNMSDINLYGNVIKMHSYFYFDDLNVTLFMNSNIEIKPFEEKIQKYFTSLYRAYKNEFENFGKYCYDPTNVFRRLSDAGTLWLQYLCQQEI